MMNNALTTTHTDNFAMAAVNSTNTIVGTMLKFSKGRWLIGRDGDALPKGARFEVIDTTVGWTKFVDGRVAEQRLGFPVCAREELDDFDEEAWPLGVDGRPQDPWSLQNFLYLLNAESGQDFTFVTSSWGGRGAVEALCRQVANKRVFFPGAVAIVGCETGYKKSPRFGDVPAPRFTVTGWNGIEVAAPPPAADLGRVIDDEIPF